MKYLYLLINVFSISIPLLYSFNKKMRFIRHWKAVLTSLTIVALFFLCWDAIFTYYGVWGFNKSYHLPFLILGMPLEEWLFFFCIPYASIFIHYSLAYFTPNFLVPKTITKLITVIAILIALYLLIINYTKLYTLVNYVVLISVLGYGYFKGIKYLRRFYIAFIVILIPFFIVNGILTGTGISEPVVWYNNAENMGIRIGTIPVEDIGYAFSMLFTNILLVDFFKEEETFLNYKN